ncbi:hypothetical protein [Flavobacterium sp. 3HN19-14]|uniref:hypothetical protein n=1 Tax=Flavobacterium sp. 3HN19-14 TaxID=3448133 RepID=UPI003EE150A8
MMDVVLYYKISVTILLISGFHCGAELLGIPEKFLDFADPSTDRKNKYSKWLVIHGLQMVLALAALTTLLLSEISIFRIFFVLLTFINLYSYLIRSIGKDGSDQLRLISYLSFSLCFLLEEHTGAAISLYFAGCQVLLAYTTSGLLKLLSPYWRKGDVLAGILGTYSFGSPNFSKLLLAHPRLEKILSHAAIFTMLSVIIAFFLPYDMPLYIALAMIFSFHFGTAVLMGLNDFLFTFPLGYPGIILLHEALYSGCRHFSFPNLY